MSERFLSEEDLDLAKLSWEELLAWWDLWLRQAQCTNELDEHVYSHGVFRVEPGWVLGPEGVKLVDERSEKRRLAEERDHNGSDRSDG